MRINLDGVRGTGHKRALCINVNMTDGLRSLSSYGSVTPGGAQVQLVHIKTVVEE